MRRALPALVTLAAAAAATLPATASAAPVGDYACNIKLSVQNELYNDSSGPFTASGSGECWVGDPTDRVPTQFSASGTYQAQKCSLISIAQPSYLTLTGTLTLTPSGGSPVSTGMKIVTADVGTANTGAGTIALDSGRRGAVTVSYDNPVLGTIARCGGNRFRPQYSGTFL